MLRAASNADRRRLTMAACDCAETAIDFASASPDGEDDPQTVLNLARAWCRGAATAWTVQWSVYEMKKLRARRSADLAVIQAASVVGGTVSASSAAIHAADALASGDPTRAYRVSVARALADMAPLVDRWLPLPVVLLSILGHPTAVPFNPSTVPASSTGPRKNPRRRRRVR
jgi:hypothetical protein